MDALIASVLLFPLVLAVAMAARTSRPVAARLAALAPLPALLLALGAPTGLALDVPWLLLGSRFELDQTGRLFLGFSALVWLLAGWYARGYLRDDPRRHLFQGFFLAAQTGNLGLCLASDAVSFYLLFALMTFSAYGLVIHSGSLEARRAGRVYIVMAVLGEAALAAGMVLAARAAGSILLADIVAAPLLPLSAVLLLLAGFGVKVGVPLLHMWLPLAHPVAPLPASAVLSAVMIKAGLLGWLRFLPLGTAALPEVGAALMTAGLAAAFLGVAAGLAQRDAKVLLAYSSVSQMGYLALAVGAGLRAPELWPALLPAVGLYAVHHALAKGALFLGVGVGAGPWRAILGAGWARPASPGPGGSPVHQRHAGQVLPQNRPRRTGRRLGGPAARAARPGDAGDGTAHGATADSAGGPETGPCARGTDRSLGGHCCWPGSPFPCGCHPPALRPGWPTSRPWAPRCGPSSLLRCWRWPSGAQAGVCPSCRRAICWCRWSSSGRVIGRRCRRGRRQAPGVAGIGQGGWQRRLHGRSNALSADDRDTRSPQPVSLRLTVWRCRLQGRHARLRAAAHGGDADLGAGAPSGANGGDEAMTGAREVRAHIHGCLKYEHRKSRARDDEVRTDPGRYDYCNP